MILISPFFHVFKQRLAVWQLITLMLRMCTLLSLWKLPWIWIKRQTAWKALHRGAQGRYPRPQQQSPLETLLVVGRVCCLHACPACWGLLWSQPKGWRALTPAVVPTSTRPADAHVWDKQGGQKYKETLGWKLPSSLNSAPGAHILPNPEGLALKSWVSFLTGNKNNAVSTSYISMGIV